MRRTTSAVAILFALLIASCSNPAADKPRAVTSDAAPSAPAQTTQGDKYQITPANSKILFVGSKVTGSHNGSFEKFSGTITYNGKPETSTVRIDMETSSIKTDDDGLTKHLMTPDFFDVATFPKATFESTEIKAGGDKGASHTVTGNLNLHGVTKSISFPATIAASGDAITVNSSFAINRKDFGINYAGAANNLIRDDVVLTLNVRATK